MVDVSVIQKGGFVISYNQKHGTGKAESREREYMNVPREELEARAKVEVLDGANAYRMRWKVGLQYLRGRNQYHNTP